MLWYALVRFGTYVSESCFLHGGTAVLRKSACVVLFVADSNILQSHLSPSIFSDLICLVQEMSPLLNMGHGHGATFRFDIFSMQRWDTWAHLPEAACRVTFTSSKLPLQVVSPTYSIFDGVTDFKKLSCPLLLTCLLYRTNGTRSQPTSIIISSVRSSHKYWEFQVTDRLNIDKVDTIRSPRTVPDNTSHCWWLNIS